MIILGKQISHNLRFFSSDVCIVPHAQEGTVCATSNRTIVSDGPSTSTTGSGREDGSNSVGPWDINLRVQQLVQEFGISELQVTINCMLHASLMHDFLLSLMHSFLPMLPPVFIIHASTNFVFLLNLSPVVYYP